MLSDVPPFFTSSSTLVADFKIIGGDRLATTPIHVKVRGSLSARSHCQDIDGRYRSYNVNKVVLSHNSQFFETLFAVCCLCCEFVSLLKF